MDYAGFPLTDSVTVQFCRPVSLVFMCRFGIQALVSDSQYLQPLSKEIDAFLKSHNRTTPSQVKLEAKDLIAKCESSLEHIRAGLQKIHAMESALVSQQNDLSSLLSPIRVLPDDVLREIFSISVAHPKECTPLLSASRLCALNEVAPDPESHSHCYPQRCKTLASLALTCNRWKSIIYETAAFWNYMSLSLDDFQAGPEPRVTRLGLDSILKRSKHSLLDLGLNVGKGLFETPAEIVKCSDRLQHMSLAVAEEGQLRALVNPQLNSYSNLTSLHVEYATEDYSFDLDPRPFSFPGENPSDLTSLVSLRSLTIRHIPLRVFRVPWSQLTDITLISVEMEDPTSIRAILLQCQHLRRALISMTPWSQRDHPRPANAQGIVLPHLHWLDIRVGNSHGYSDEDYDIGALFQPLTIPALEYLAISTFNDPDTNRGWIQDDMRAFAQRSLGNLTILRLGCMTIEEPHLREIFMVCTQVENLELMEFNFPIDDILRLLTPSLQPNAVPLPALKSFIYDGHDVDDCIFDLDGPTPQAVLSFLQERFQTPAHCAKISSLEILNMIKNDEQDEDCEQQLELPKGIETQLNLYQRGGLRLMVDLWWYIISAFFNVWNADGSLQGTLEAIVDLKQSHDGQISLCSVQLFYVLNVSVSSFFFIHVYLSTSSDLMSSYPHVCSADIAQ
jgi:hypothetical protein